MKPKVSVLMPIYNCERYAAESIESILNQSFGDLELIIVDGGSTDRTLEVIERFKDPRMRIVKHKKRFGLIESRNEGLCLARGSLVALQDADDISHRQRIAKQYSSFLHDSDLAVLGTSYFRIDQKRRVFAKVNLKNQVSFLDFEHGMQMCNGSIMFRKDIVLKEGLFDPFFKQCEDYELCCRLGKKGYKIMNLGENLYFLREHLGRLSVSKWQEQALYAFLVHDIYFGKLEKGKAKKSLKTNFDYLYSLLSSETKKDYHVYLTLNYMKSRKYLHGILELLHLAKLNPKEFSRLLGKSMSAAGRLANPNA